MDGGNLSSMSAAQLREMCRRLLDERHVTPVLLSKLTETYVEHRHARVGTAQSTLRRYRDTARFLIARLGDRSLDAYSRDELERVLLSEETLWDGVTASWSTRRYRVRAAKALWSYAMSHGHLIVNLMAGVSADGHDPQRLPVELEVKVLKQILYTARCDHQHPWLVDALTLLAVTCLRPVELWRLSWRNVELDGIEKSRLLLDGHIRRKNPTPAIYPLCPESVEILTRWHARTMLAVGAERMPKAPVIWGRIIDIGVLARLNTGMITHLFGRIVRNIGARCLRGEIPTLYTLRHFYCQLFEGRANQDVRMRLMGHSTPGIAPRHYMSAMEEEQREVTRAFPRLG